MKQNPLENSMSDNQVVEKKAKIKKTDVLSKCLQGNHLGRLVAVENSWVEQ